MSEEANGLLIIMALFSVIAAIVGFTSYLETRAEKKRTQEILKRLKQRRRSYD